MKHYISKELLLNVRSYNDLLKAAAKISASLRRYSGESADVAVCTRSLPAITDHIDLLKSALLMAECYSEYPGYPAFVKGVRRSIALARDAMDRRRAALVSRETDVPRAACRFSTSVRSAFVAAVPAGWYAAGPEERRYTTVDGADPEQHLLFQTLLTVNGLRSGAGDSHVYKSFTLAATTRVAPSGTTHYLQALAGALEPGNFDLGVRADSQAGAVLRNLLAPYCDLPADVKPLRLVDAAGVDSVTVVDGSVRVHCRDLDDASRHALEKAVAGLASLCQVVGLAWRSGHSLEFKLHAASVDRPLLLGLRDRLGLTAKSVRSLKGMLLGGRCAAPH